MKRSGRPTDSKKFHELRHLVRRVTELSYERYLGDILGMTTTTGQEENRPPKVHTKTLYSLLKHSKQYASGVAPLKLDGRTLSNDCEKSNVLTDNSSLFSAPNPRNA